MCWKPGEFEGPKIAKLQTSPNPIRSAQNVSRVPISMGAGFKHQQRPIWDQNCKDPQKSKMLGPKRVPIWGPYWPMGVSFADTGMVRLRLNEAICLRIVSNPHLTLQGNWTKSTWYKHSPKATSHHSNTYFWRTHPIHGKKATEINLPCSVMRTNSHSK